MAESLRISPADAKARIDSGQALVLDVVSPLAWDQLDLVVSGALRVPPDEIGSRMQELPKGRDLIAYCT